VPAAGDFWHGGTAPEFISTTNIEQSNANIQRYGRAFHWMFDAQCSMFPLKNKKPQAVSSLGR